MWSTTLSNIIVLPCLFLISIPLALSAFITSTLALTTLFLRALVVYFELVIALLANFFLFPAHSPASGSLLALTEGNTPGAGRSTLHGRGMRYGHQQMGLVKSRRGSISSKEGIVEDYFFHSDHHNHQQPAHASLHSSHEALLTFISGNAERDFEGVGGWRTPLPRKKQPHHNNTTSSASSSLSYNNSSGEDELLSDNDDDEAWLSINKRLELPSRRLHPPSPMLSPKLTTTMTTTTTAVEENLRPQHQQHHPQQRPRFHRRSKTSPLPPTHDSTAGKNPQPASAQQPSKQLQTSSSSAGLATLSSLLTPRPSSSSFTPSPSSSSSWLDSGVGPLPMTSSFSGVGADDKMVHHHHPHISLLLPLDGGHGDGVRGVRRLRQRLCL